MMFRQPAVVLTGGPGGGKSTLIEELSRDPVWRVHFAALPEAIALMGGLGIPSREKLFQRVMVHLQLALEDGLAHALGLEDQRILLCHRGSLDPLAYWLDRGWTEEGFFAFTQMKREDHYRRYALVIHLVTAADGAAEAYTRWPEAHRPETIEQAIRIDQFLQRVWGDHPHYICIDNAGRDWAAKAAEAKRVLSRFL